ncbi:MAG: trypsin-like peptidase domain-containing protein [Planctomycetaceae bacterium]
MNHRFPVLALLSGLLLGFGCAAWMTREGSFGAAPALALDEQLARSNSELRGTGPLHESSRLLAKVAQHVTPSVVHLQSKRTIQGGTVEETGSGVLIGNERIPGVYVVTNRHVISDSKMANVAVHLHDGRVLHPTRIWSDKATDLAVLKVEADGLPTAAWGDSQNLEIGHVVLALGSPFGLSQSVTFGIISAKGRRSLKLGEGTEVLNQDFLQTDAAINPGNSGGPLVDLNGEVVGINTAIASNSGGNDGIGFSIPSHLARRVVDQLLNDGKVTRAYLGVKLDPEFTSETAVKLRLDRIRGARVTEVYQQTPASRSDLRINDVIMLFDGTEVLDENHLINLVSLTPIDKQVRLQLWRDGKKVSVEVVLGDRDELEQRSASYRRDQAIPADSMGLTVERVDSDIAEQLGFRSLSAGLMITHVPHAGPLADRLQPGDLLLEVAGEAVTTLDDLSRILEANAERGTLVLKVRRKTGDAEETQIVLWKRIE